MRIIWERLRKYGNWEVFFKSEINGFCLIEDYRRISKFKEDYDIDRYDFKALISKSIVDITNKDLVNVESVMGWKFICSGIFNWW